MLSPSPRIPNRSLKTLIPGSDPGFFVFWGFPCAFGAYFAHAKHFSPFRCAFYHFFAHGTGFVTCPGVQRAAQIHSGVGCRAYGQKKIIWMDRKDGGLRGLWPLGSWRLPGGCTAGRPPSLLPPLPEVGNGQPLHEPFNGARAGVVP